MKNSYCIKDKVWIHLGEQNLVQGRIVEIIDLEHLGEGHDPKRDLYVIEIKTGIDDVYEVRSFEQISSDQYGPINLFRSLDNVRENNRYFKKVGMPLPVGTKSLDSLDDHDEPTPEEIQAALDRSQEIIKHPALNLQKETKFRRRYPKKKKQ